MRKFLDTEQTGQRSAKHKMLLNQVIVAILQEQKETIPEICQLYKWSIPTGIKLVTELVEESILLKKGKKDSNGGRRPDIYSLNPAMGYVIGIEILLKSLKISVVNLNHEIIYANEEIQFDITDQDKTLKTLEKIVPDLIIKQKLNRQKILGVGIGITGRVNRNTGKSYTYLNYDTPIQQLLQDKWQLPVYIDNDTHLMALGEKTFGYAKGKSDVFIVNLGRGIGAAIISNGMIHSGHSGFAGEFGHMHITENERICVCGKTGCLETVVSGIALEDALANNQEPAEKKKKPTDYRYLLQKAKKGDQEITKVLSKMGEDLGKALSLIVHLLNPELIVISGGFSQAAEQLIYPIARGMNLYGLPQLLADCDLRVSSLGENATILGAFTMVFEKEFNHKF